MAYETYTGLQWAAAFWNVGLFCSPFVMTVELVGHKYAAICSIIINIPFVIGELILVAIAYFFRDFRTLLRVAFLPPLAAILLCFFIPESPRQDHIVIMTRYSQKVPSIRFRYLELHFIVKKFWLYDKLC